MKNTYAAKRIDTGKVVTGYYVFCRGRHYILESYNGNGYDERWETSEWIEVDEKTIKNERIEQLEQVLGVIKDNVLINYKKDNKWYNLAYNILNARKTS